MKWRETKVTSSKGDVGGRWGPGRAKRFGTTDQPRQIRFPAQATPKKHPQLSTRHLTFSLLGIHRANTVTMAQNRHWYAFRSPPLPFSYILTKPREQDKEATVYIGNIDERATSAIVYEIMLQLGPIHNIHLPRDRVTQTHQGFGFVEFRTAQDAEYAANVMNGVKLYGKSLRVNKASADKARAGAEVGAELFVGNLDPMADEKVLYDTFSRFGPLLTMPKVARDDAGNSRGFGFASFADFDSSDAAVANLDGQYLMSKEISVQYAFKKDGKGERHGDDAERELAAQAKKRNIVPESQPLPPAFTQQPPSQAAAPAGFDAVAHPQAFAPRGPPPTYNGAAPVVRAAAAAAAPLPPAPSGLPARPPQGQSYNPADFHPGGFRPPSGSPNPQGYAAAPPPPAPPGFGGQGAPPPPGFMPPPGFQPPPGFGGGRR